MDTKEQPGIAFVDVGLTNIHFAVKGSLAKETKLGIDWTAQSEIDNDARILTISLACDLFGGLPDSEKPPIEFSFKFVGKFKAEENSAMSLEEFADGFAPAHLVPYARELISDITSRSFLPTLRLGPINVLSLFRENKKHNIIVTAKKKPQQES